MYIDSFDDKDGSRPTDGRSPSRSRKAGNRRRPPIRYGDSRGGWVRRTPRILPAEGGSILFGSAIVTAVPVVGGDPFYDVRPAD